MKTFKEHLNEDTTDEHGSDLESASNHYSDAQISKRLKDHKAHAMHMHHYHEAMARVNKRHSSAVQYHKSESGKHRTIWLAK